MADESDKPDRPQQAPAEEEAPFWERKALHELSREEWESLCDGCARCCVFRLEDERTGERIGTNVCCDLLNTDSCRCTNYPLRSLKQPMCITLTPELLARDCAWLPGTCAYRRVAEGRGLEWWHPLVSGTGETVVEAGISVRGRVIHERDADDLEQHLVDGWLTD